MSTSEPPDAATKPRSTARILFSSGTGFLVTLRVGGQDLSSLSVSPAKSASTPDWNLLWLFPVALLIAAVTLVPASVKGHWEHWGAWGDWGTAGEKPKKWWKHNKGPGLKWWRSYPLHFAATWSLKDSWASNVTVVAAAFAGVFGSSTVLKAVSGTDTDPILALTIVSSAIAVGIIGAAPLVLADLRSKGDVTPAALLIGASLTVGAAGGELAVIALGVRHLNLGGVQNWLPWIGLVGGGLVLLVYAFRTMVGSLVPAPRARPKGAMPKRKPAQVNDDAFQKLNELAALLPDISPVEAVNAAYDEPLPRREEERRSALF